MADNGAEVVGLVRTTTSDNTDQPSLNPTKTPQLERHISSIPQDDDDDNNDQSNQETTKSRNPLQRLKNKIANKTSSSSRSGDNDTNNAETQQPQQSSLTGPDMPAPLKRTISNIRADDYDSDHEGSLQPPAAQHSSRPATQEKDDATGANLDDERHDSGISNNSEFEVSPMLRISRDEAKPSDPATARPELERHISQVPQDGGGGGGGGDAMRARLERTISHIPQEDYDSDD